jgi:hypothetical protein
VTPASVTDALWFCAGASVAGLAIALYFMTSTLRTHSRMRKQNQP